MSQELIPLAEFPHSTEAGLAKGLLENQGVFVWLTGEHGSDLGLTVKGICSSVRLCVLVGDMERALDILRSLSLDCKFLIERA